MSAACVYALVIQSRAQLLGKHLEAVISDIIQIGTANSLRCNEAFIVKLAEDLAAPFAAQRNIIEIIAKQRPISL